MGSRILPLLVPQPADAGLAQRVHLALLIPQPSAAVVTIPALGQVLVGRAATRDGLSGRVATREDLSGRSHREG